MANNPGGIIITAVDRTRAAFNSAVSNAENLDRAISGLSKGLAVIGGVAGFGEFIRAGFDAGNELYKFTQLIGISANELTRLQYAIHQTADVTNEELNSALVDLREKISDAAHGTSDISTAFTRLGLDAAQLNKMRPDQQLYAIADAFKAMKNHGDAVFTLRQISDSLTPLLPALQGGGKGLHDLAEGATQLGVVLTDQQTKNIHDLSIEFGLLKNETVALSTSLTAFFAPAITVILKSFEAIEEKAKNISWGNIFSGLSSFLPGIGTFVTFANSGIMKKILEQFQGGKDLLQAFDKAMALVGEDSKFLNENLTVLSKTQLNQKLKELQEQLKNINFDEIGSEGLATKIKEQIEKVKAEIKSRPIEIIVNAKINFFRNMITAQLAQGLQDDLDLQKKYEEQSKQINDSLMTDAEKYQQKLKEINDIQINAPEILSTPGQGDNSEEVANKARIKAGEEFMTAQKANAKDYKKLWFDVGDSVSKSLGDSVAGVIAHQMSAKDALRGILADVVKQTIAGMIAIFVQKQIIDKASIALGFTSVAATHVQAAATAAAWAPAAGLSSLATFGTNIIPAAAAITAIIALAKITGIADNGLDFVKNHGTYLLERGEGVIKKGDNERIPALLSRLDGGAAGRSDVNFNVSIQALDTQNALDVFHGAIARSEGKIIDIVQRAYQRRGSFGGPQR